MGALAALWLASPVLTGSHLECFSQRLLTLAVYHRRGALALDDYLFPIFSEYLYTTRLGVVHLLEGLTWLTGSASNANFRVLMAVSLLGAAASCVRFARRWGAEPAWAALAALVLLPGFFESSFLFADNLPSAAFAMAGMALVGRDTPVAHWGVIGALFAGAVLCRLDAVYTLPLYPALLLAARRRSPGEVASAGLAFAGGAVGVFLTSWFLTGVSLPVSLRVGAFFAKLHIDNVRLLRDTVPSALAFFGLLLPPLLLAGGWANARRMARREGLGLVAAPALLYLYLLPKVQYPRVFLLLGLPFLVLHGAAGVRLLADAWRDRRPVRRWGARAALAAAVALYALPPVAFERDGPRAVVGRIWSPLLWREFQGREALGEARARALVDGVRPGRPAWVISPTWQSDAAFHLALTQRGWHKVPPPEPGADLCARIAEVYADGDRRLVQYRLEDPYGMADRPPLRVRREYAEAYQVAQAARCIAAAGYGAGTLADWDAVQYSIQHLRVVARSPQPAFTLFPVHFPGPVAKHQRLRALRLIPVAPGDLAGVVQDAGAVMAREVASGRSRPIAAYDEFLAFYQPRYWQALAWPNVPKRPAAGGASGL